MGLKKKRCERLLKKYSQGLILSPFIRKYTYDQLDYYGKTLKNKLLDIDGIEKIVIGGVQDRIVKIDVNIDRFSYYGLSLKDISGILQAQNRMILIGSIENDNYMINLNTNKYN